MIFTKRARLVLMLMATISLLLACSSNSPKKNTEGKSKSAAQENVVAAGVSILPVGPATPNPYLQNKPSVSREITQQFADATRAMRNKQWAQAESLLQKIL